ncbi:hypothetical protein FQN57_004643 [Myotisia sp. PD_48]|nr:hypothetical protein FQN57_004643 [Myotisia sp. PD_48]
MTIFMLSLFLPNTIDFVIPEDWHIALHNHRRRGSTESTKRVSTLFARKSSLSSIAPGTSVLKENERIFAGLDISDGRPDSPVCVEENLPHPVTPLAPSDPHSPIWGSPGAFHQPTAQSAAHPPPSILNHTITEESASELTKILPSLISRKKERTIPQQELFADADWTVQTSEQGNGGLLNAIRSASDWTYAKDKLWVGTLGMPTDALDQKLKDSIAEKLVTDHESLTVFPGDHDFDSHYLHYCKTILWPVLHYQIPDNPKSKAYEDHSWVYYRIVNQMFADEVVRNWKRGDVIWVHDYHLLLVPAMVRQQISDAKIGLFLHVAFPSSEVFRCLSVRKELLLGMLGANLIGFQTQEYCHHFLQTCSRLLNVEATNDGVQLEDHFVNVGTFPIGIDPVSLDVRRQCAEVRSRIDILQKKFEGKRLLIARDKLDNVSGVRQKLLAFELFLNKYPEWCESVVFIQVASTTTEQPELEAAVSDIATRINSLHSNLAHQPLIFHKQDLLFDQYLALISVADIFMVTSLREGMNLTSHEFIHCQDGQFSDSQYGPIILSEFAGSASMFHYHPLLVNPWNYHQCADAIKTALDMNPMEKKRQWARLNDTVNTHIAPRWVNGFTDALNKAYNEQSCRETVAVPRLSVTNLCNKYRESSHRLFLLDFEGTLATWGQPTNIIMTTPKRAIDTLNDLLEDPKNTVYVMSSRMPEEMERLFRRVSGLGLIAENGCFVREPHNPDEWIPLIDDEKVKKWKQSLAGMLQYFQERTEGSWIEERHASLVFHYANAEDPLSAERHASECANNINDSCNNHGLRAVLVDRSVVAEPIVPNKATAASMMLESFVKRTKQVSDPLIGKVPDFFLIIGDGRDDEVVFRWANQLSETHAIENLTTVTLGLKNTEAMATLAQGVAGTLSCLGKLGDISQQRATEIQNRFSFTGKDV